MGGEIGVRRNAEGGSTFWFTVRLSRRDTRPNYEEAHYQALRRVRALIVDDNSTNREIVSEQLSSWNIRHRNVPSGEEGLEALRGAVFGEDPFGLIILDKHMPGMDGLELARKIRSDPSIEAVRIMMLSSVSREQVSTINIRKPSQSYELTSNLVFRD